MLVLLLSRPIPADSPRRLRGISSSPAVVIVDDQVISAPEADVKGASCLRVSNGEEVFDIMRDSIALLIIEVRLSVVLTSARLSKRESEGTETERARVFRTVLEEDASAEMRRFFLSILPTDEGVLGVFLLLFDVVVVPLEGALLERGFSAGTMPRITGVKAALMLVELRAVVKRVAGS